MKILVTGNTGFIGFYLAQRLLQRGDDVVGIDSINDYYDPSLKQGAGYHQGNANNNWVFHA